MQNRLQLDSRSFTTRKQQTMAGLSHLEAKVNERDSVHTLVSKDDRQMIIIGNQPDGTFGIASYELDGDKYKLNTSLENGLVLLPGSQEIEGDDFISIENDNGDYKVVLQDTVRIAALESVYPIGTIYENDTDSRSPGVLMNWNNSSWQKLDNAVRVSKDMDNPSSNPIYTSIFRWKRLG